MAETNESNGVPLFRRSNNYIIVALCGAVVILISYTLKDKLDEVWFGTLVAIGQALIVGPTISRILDLPSMIKYFKKITIKSLVSQDYLKTLSRDKLVDLRKKCTARIHLQDVQVEQGLIDLDEEICELLTNHYHEIYRQNVTCKIEGEFVQKKHDIEEVMINPLAGTGKSITIKEDMKNYIFKYDVDRPEEIFEIIKYKVKIDDKEEKDYKNQIQFKIVETDTADANYNASLTLYDLEDRPLEFEFLKTLRIEKVYKIRVPKADTTFTKRVKIPVKSFRLAYHFLDSNVTLVAACFGTLAFSDQGNIKVIHEPDHISVESYSWLLPGNGVYVVAI